MVIDFVQVIETIAYIAEFLTATASVIPDYQSRQELTTILRRDFESPLDFSATSLS